MVLRTSVAVASLLEVSSLVPVLHILVEVVSFLEVVVSSLVVALRILVVVVSSTLVPSSSVVLLSLLHAIRMYLIVLLKTFPLEVVQLDSVLSYASSMLLVVVSVVDQLVVLSPLMNSPSALYDMFAQVFQDSVQCQSDRCGYQWLL